jgi:hypothetical protein
MKTLPPRILSLRLLILISFFNLILGADIRADVFGSGSNQFGIDFVTIGNPGNTNDTTGYGSVGYVYRIAKYELTASQYVSFLNDIAKTDPENLYRTTGDFPISGAILRQGSSGSFSYTVRSGWSNIPVQISWFEAARYCNYLHNGAQSDSDTEHGAYELNGAHTGVFNKNPNALYWIPSENEWYKAAYFDPQKNNQGAGYWLYPIKSDQVNTNSANYGMAYGGSEYFYLTPVGFFTNAPSPFGTFDQGGNVWEWNDSVTAGTVRGIRGGGAIGSGFFPFGWYGGLAATARGEGSPTGSDVDYMGLRIASVPSVSISSQPQNVSLTATNRQTATFSVVATNGVPPYAYQWMKDGMDLTNQTNASLVLSNAGANTVGYYSCDVTDQTGTTVTSSNASLAISGVNFGLWQGLVSYYPFNRNTLDNSLNGNHATGSNLQFFTDRFGISTNAALFSKDTILAAPNLQNLEYRPTTYSLWLNMQESPLPGNILTIIGRMRSWDLEDGALVITSSGMMIGGHNEIVYYTGGSVLRSNFQVTTNQWFNLTFTYDDNQLANFYINGKLVKSSVFSASQLINHPFLIGASSILDGIDNNDTHSWLGGIDDVRIYNRALSSNEVTSLFESEAPGIKDQTIVFSSFTSRPFGSAPIILNAISRPSGLPITYSSSNTNVATVSGNTLTIRGAGTTTVTATQSGAYPWRAATPANRTLIVTQAKQSLGSFTPIADKTFGDAPFAISPPSASSGLPVTVRVTSGPGSMSNNVLTMTGAGLIRLSADQPGNSNFSAARSGTAVLRVNKRPQTITFSLERNRNFVSRGTFTLSATSSAGRAVRFTSSNPSVLAISGSTATMISKGTVTITASAIGDQNTAAGSSTSTITLQ